MTREFGVGVRGLVVLAGLAALGAGLGALGCSRCAAERAPVVEEALPAAPPGMVAEFFLADLPATWAAARELTGVGALFPVDPAVLLARVLGLRVELAGQLDTTAELAGVLLSPPPKPGAPTDLTGAPLDGAAPVLGFALRSGRELLAALTTGADAQYVAVQAPGGLVELRPAAGAKVPASPLLGVVGNRLVAALDPEALRVAAGYVARTLPATRAGGGGLLLRVEGAALRGAWGEALFASLLPPAAPEGDGEFVAGASRKLVSLARSLQRLELRLVASPTELKARLTAFPESGGEAATALLKLRDVPLGGLLALPSDAMAGLLFGKLELVDTLEPLPADAPPGAAPALERLVGSLGGPVVVGFVPRSDLPPLGALAAVLESPEPAGTLFGAAELAAPGGGAAFLAAVHELLKVLGPSVTERTLKVGGVGEAQEIRVKGASATNRVLLVVEATRVLFAVGSAADVALQRFSGGGQATLAGDPWLPAQLPKQGLGALVLRIPAGPSAAQPPALLVSAGGAEGEVHGELVANAALVKLVMQELMRPRP